MGKSGQQRSDAVPRERVIALRLLRVPSPQIARELDITASSLSRILAEPDVMEAIAAAEHEVLEDAKRGLASLTRKAIRVLDAALDSADERIALDAAKAVTTKAGVDAATKVDATLRPLSEAKAERVAAIVRAKERA